MTNGARHRPDNGHNGEVLLYSCTTVETTHAAYRRVKVLVIDTQLNFKSYLYIYIIYSKFSLT